MTANLPRSVRDFGACFLLTSASWACWAIRTVACTDGRWAAVGGIAALEEALALAALSWVVVGRSWSAGAGCVLGAAVGAGIATAWRL